MKLDELKKSLAEKETLKQRTEAIFHQLTGQIILLAELIKTEEDNTKKEEIKEEQK